MGLQVINQGTETHNVIVDEAYEKVDKKKFDGDMRRRLENKIEDMKLQKDVQEYDFDWS